MQLDGCVAFVTGASRGLGRAYVDALLEAGARTVYAAARDAASVRRHPSVVPVVLDVTSAQQVRDAAARCPDVALVVNNAGVMSAESILGADSIAAIQRDLDVNVFGMISVARAFAPALARNGGGTILNMLSVVSWFVSPVNPTYCVSKHAAAAATEAIRQELKSSGTTVSGVYAGLIDTDMAAAVERPKSSPRDIALRALQGVARGEEYILADARAEELWRVMNGAPRTVAQHVSAG